MRTYNITPYFDDFQDDKNFHQIMFRPGYAVQARELTQLQTILRGQIEKFGNHVFKHGSIVIPGNSFYRLDVDYVKVESTYAGESLIDTEFLGRTVIGGISGVEAKVIKIEGEESNSRPKTFYLSYTKAGSHESGGETVWVNEFQAGEELSVVGGNFNTIAKIKPSNDNPIGKGSMAFVNEGVYYINGSFVSIPSQSVVISRYSQRPSCHVLLKIIEEIITHNEDGNLLDPAQGSLNYAAPGADRVKISLELVSLPLDSDITDNYVEIIRFSDGELLEHSKYPKYNELEKSLARRTYDEAGDFITEGLESTVREYLKLKDNGGVYPAENEVEEEEFEGKLVYQLNPGKAYIKGFEVENFSRKRIPVDKPRTTSTATTLSKNINYGIYSLVRVSNSDNLPIVGGKIYFQSGTGSSQTPIAEASFMNVEYHANIGTPSNRVDKIYFYDLRWHSDVHSLRNVRSITSGKTGGQVIGQFVTELSISSDQSVSNVVQDKAFEGDWSIFKSLVSYGETNTMYIYRSGGSPTDQSPITGDSLVIKDSSGNNIAIRVRSARDIQNQSISNLLIYLGKSGVKDLKNNFNSPDMSYLSWEVIEFTGATTSGTVVGIIPSLGTGNAVAYRDGSPVSLTDYYISNTGNQIVSTVAGNHKIYVQVLKSGVVPKTKTVDSNSGIGDSPITLTSNQLSAYGQNTTSRFYLHKTDAVKLDYITVTNTSDANDPLNYADRTSDFILHKNSNAFNYGYSYIELKPGVAAIPAGWEVNVQYTWLSHTGGANFFGPESYQYVPDEYVEYVQIESGEFVSLRDCIDLRASHSSAATPIVSGSTFKSSIRYYEGRIDTLCLDKDGNAVVLQGTPSNHPEYPEVSENLVPISHFRLPAYCASTRDVVIEDAAVMAYRMVDIDKINRRVEKLEEYVTLTVAESELLQMQVTDSMGNEKYKTGYVVEDFKNPFDLADPSLEDYSATITSEGLTAGRESTNLPIDLLIPMGQENFIRVSGDTVMLDWEEEVFTSNDYSTSTLQINNFNITTYNNPGALQVTPCRDNLPEVVDNLESILNDISTTTDRVADSQLFENGNDTLVADKPYVGNVIKINNKNSITQIGVGTKMQIDTLVGKNK